jgi:hypothetical protein
MSEELENQELEIPQTEPGPAMGLHGYTVDYGIYRLVAEDFASAISVIRRLEPTENHYLIEKPEGMLLVTKETFEVDQENIAEKLQ